jgi:hypothetical protein
MVTKGRYKLLNLICFIETPNDILLNHFLAHYDKLGVSRYYFLHFNNTQIFIDRPDIITIAICFEQFNEQQKNEKNTKHSVHYLFENQIKKEYILNANDWCFIVDLDEFVNITPEQIEQETSVISNNNIVKGYLLDKIANNKQIKMLQEDQPIGEQFPLGIRLTKYSNRCEKKIFLTKGHMFHSAGHHIALSKQTRESGCIYQIFHYKWFLQNMAHLSKTYPFDNFSANHELSFLEQHAFSDKLISEIQTRYPIY